jgi:hypothetical protein
MARARWSLLGLGLLLALPTGVGAQTINWQEAIARLATERTRAETCVGLLKKHGDQTAIDRGARTYGEAKAEMDGVIAGLIVALAQGDEPASLPELESKLRRGVAAREAFCAEVDPLVPEQTGEKGVIVDLVAGAVGPLVEAVQAIWLDAAQARREADRLKAKTIQTQLEATAWPVFASVPSSP